MEEKKNIQDNKPKKQEKVKKSNLNKISARFNLKNTTKKSVKKH